MSDPTRDPDARTTRWIHRAWRSPWPWLVLVGIVFCAPLFFNLDGTELENDEAIYTYAVDVMLEDGDWLTPKSIPSPTYPFLEKPPLKFWLNALPIWLGVVPHNTFGIRVTDAVLGSLAFLYVFAIGRRLRGPICGFVAVFLLFIDQRILFEHGIRANNMESAVLLSYAGGVYHFLAWRSVNPDVKRHVYAMALWFVVGFMTKFVAALFLPVVLAAAALIKREDRVRVYRDWHAFAGAAVLCLALVLPWFLYQYFVQEPRVFGTMFGEHVVKRFTSYLDPEHLQPWHFYFTDLWAALGSAGTRWIVLLGIVAVAWRTLRRRWVEGALLLLWFGLPVAAISTGTSKVSHYLYPFLPALYLCGGYLLATLAEWMERRWRKPLPRLEFVRAGLVAAGLLVVLPLGRYDSTVERTRRVDRRLRALVECTLPVSQRLVAEGRRGPAVWSDADLSHVPIYYLQPLGLWQRAGQSSTEATVEWIVYRPARVIVIGEAQWDAMQHDLTAGRAGLVARLAALAGPDPDIERKLRQAAVGIVRYDGSLFVLPDPLAACGTEVVPLVSR